ncbi:bifunctional TVP38/TMEM64 family protein/FAD-dependent oxidoreductase [Hydrogenophaga sp.]|uniref:FAD-dependent oxidoreductase n=1 Tax=Hydrogenophaga sp. TaxID=1904254 RepID=UPI0019B1214D|nr:bifunctional TVP38/TMEM64 family protein/FAD-dependent oxidoreductase [Hydrogenophaga sp.]MBD3892890.1 pyridine nucleotide-disulfide oxidoreductase [Hydrogenophaga sp.]
MQASPANSTSVPQPAPASGSRFPQRAWLWAGLALAAVLGVALYQHFGLGELLTLERLKLSRDSLISAYQANPALAILAFFGLYVVATALSIPGALILTLAGGAIFGFWVGLLIVSFASSVGALLAFLASRYLLRGWLQAKYARALAPINEGLQRDGTAYLLTLRLVPVFPFWLVNLLMGLTSITATRFYIVSQIGMLAGTAVFVNAGTRVAALESAGDVFSPAMLGSFALLGIFPLISKALVGWSQRRKVYARWPKPASFDRNLVVIGAGAGGLVSSYIAAAVKAKVSLIEGHKMGGDCLNYGCVPSKALIRSAKMAKQFQKAEAFGFKGAAASLDFASVMQRIHGVIRDIEPHDSVERYTRLGVDVVQGHARITSPWSVEITQADGRQRTLTTRNIVIATGASPFVPPIPGLQDAGFLTSDTVWKLTALPKRLLVLGGGPIGCELAQSFARLGSEVTQVEMAPRVMVREDPEVSEIVAQSLQADGVRLLTQHQAVRVEMVAGEKRLIARHGDQEVVIAFDELLCAVGRAPRVTGFGLEELGIPLTSRKTVETNAYLQTLYPNIYAVGDVAGPFQFTHTAAHQAWYAAVNALFGRFKKFKADYRVIPWATFTDPEVARVGLSETEATDQGVPFEVTRYGIDDLDRAIADGSAHGFVKVLTVPGKDKILGVTIVGEHAGDLLAEYVLAMKHGLGLNKILGTIHTYPTLAEANKYVAGEWKRAHAPKKLLQWIARYHNWERA